MHDLPLPQLRTLVMKQCSDMLATANLFGWGSCCSWTSRWTESHSCLCSSSPNQQCEIVQLGQCSIGLALQAPLQCIEEGCDVDWRSTIVGAVVGLFEVPTNMEQCRRAVAKIQKKNNLMFLRMCKYHLLQLAEKLTVATNRQLTQAERNSVLNYKDYLFE